MTSDFLVNLGNVEMAIAIKPASELEDERTVEKLEIERKYWQNRNIDWGIVMDLDLPDTIVRNIEWFYKEFRFSNKSRDYRQNSTLSKQLKPHTLLICRNLGFRRKFTQVVLISAYSDLGIVAI